MQMRSEMTGGDASPNPVDGGMTDANVRARCNSPTQTTSFSSNKNVGRPHALSQLLTSSTPSTSTSAMESPSYTLTRGARSLQSLLIDKRPMRSLFHCLRGHRHSIRRATSLLLLLLLCLCVLNISLLILPGFDDKEENEWQAGVDADRYFFQQVPPATLPDAVALGTYRDTEARAEDGTTVFLTTAAAARDTHEIPSWTLHVVHSHCTTCLDHADYAEAMRRSGITVGGHAAAAAAVDETGDTSHAVFATASSPMGYIGPMLLAMASVTDDVAWRAELRRWSWMPRQSADAVSARHFYSTASSAQLHETCTHRGGGGEAHSSHTCAPRPSRSPHLAVMGIPSTDQTYRLQLRNGQRQSWHRYADVATADNDFDAALLVLYIFAAGDLREAEMTQTYRNSLRGIDLGTGSKTPVAESLLPTQTEVSEAARCVQQHTDNGEEDQPAAAACVAVNRRIALRQDWARVAPAESPCAGVTTGTVSKGAYADTSAALREALELPVTPLWVTPAKLICHASSALWAESLTYRNTLWLDMLLDKRPTTKKRFGKTGRQGRETEIGMTKKVILWFNYAYDTFPDTPYIVKGDDDAYIKVPQLVRNILNVRNGRPASPVRVPVATNRKSAGLAPRPPHWQMEAKFDECHFWILRYGVSVNIPYGAGMLYMLDRRLALTALLAPNRSTAPKRAESARDMDIVRLVTYPYGDRFNDLYGRGELYYEDMLLGNLVLTRGDYIRTICPTPYPRYISESKATFYDLRLRNGALRWSAVVLHRCLPADYPYIHRYFSTERAVALAMLGTGKPKSDAAASAALQKWAKANIDPTLPGYGKWPRAVWARDVQRVCAWEDDGVDNTTVYGTRYVPKKMRLMPHAYSVVPRTITGTC